MILRTAYSAEGGGLERELDILNFRKLYASLILNLPGLFWWRKTSWFSWCIWSSQSALGPRGKYNPSPPFVREACDAYRLDDDVIKTMALLMYSQYQAAHFIR